MNKYKITQKDKIRTIAWSFKLAWKIDKRMLLLWFGLSISLSVLPAVALIYNRKIIANISAFISSGHGSFYSVMPDIIILGIILTAVGLSGRINGDLLYMMMYDSYYLGMEELMMNTIQKVEMKTLLNKEINDEYNAIIIRGGSLTDFMSAFCTFSSKLVSIISLLIVAFSASRIIFIISSFYIIIAVFFNGSYAKKEGYNMNKLREDERLTDYYQKMTQTPGIAKEMRIYESKDSVMSQWEKAYKRIEDFNKHRVFGTEMHSFISGIGFYIFMIGIIVYSIFRVYLGHMGADIFLMVYVLCQNLSNTITEIANSFLRAEFGLYPLDRQRKFIAAVPKISVTDESSLTAHPINRTVFEAKNLTFCYKDDCPVLKNVNLKINKGEIIALVGYNGSGKTTLVKLLLGLFKPTSGELLFYGKPYSKYKHGFINSCIGVFFQNFYLFHASLKENIGFGDLKNIKNEEKILKAISKGGAEKILSKLPKGLENWIGKDVDQEGAALSGGEKQKIAVSRAYMSDKEIMIFDEPAAALDPIAEMEQFMNIKEKINGRTAVLISHRVGFARLADRIIVLNGGKIAEDGTHDELMKQNGLYAKFFTQQAQWYDTADKYNTKAV